MSKAKPSTFMKKIEASGASKEVVHAFAHVDRSLFFDPFFKDRIEDTAPVPIGNGEFSDDALVLARMINILGLHKKWTLLEVGTGSGYSTAVLSTLVSKIVTVEFHEKLASAAKNRLIDNGYFNIKFLAGDCAELDDTAGSFDAAIIYGGCTHSPYAVLNLLKKNGIAVFPMGPLHMKQLTFYKNAALKDNDNPFSRYKFHETGEFPSLKGQYGAANPELNMIVTPK